MARTTGIAPHHLLGLTMPEYQRAEITSAGHRYPLADDIRGHLVAILLAEQAEEERRSGVTQRAPRHRPRKDSANGSIGSTGSH